MVVGAETLLVTKLKIKVNIQSSSGGKVNILGGDSIGHCEKKSSYQRGSGSGLSQR